MWRGFTGKCLQEEQARGRGGKEPEQVSSGDRGVKFEQRSQSPQV